MAKIPHGSIEYLHIPITVDDDTLNVDLVGVTVEVAVIGESADPVAEGTVWRATTVDGDASAVVARTLLQGLAVGRYAVWVRLHAAPEVPLRKAGVLTVT